MADTDFITDALNVASDDIASFSKIKENDHYTFKITLKNKHPECPFCGGHSSLKEYKIRTYHHLPIFGFPSVIEWKRIRYICKDCNRTFSEANPFGPENFHQTYASLSQIANDLSNPNYSFTAIAEKNHISPTMVQGYFDSFVHVSRQPLPEWICIDEIHSDMSKYGGSYLCVLSDGMNRVPFEILPNRSKKTLSKYFESIPIEERNRVKYVTTDLWDPYREVSKKYFKNCIVAADPFHVVKNLIDPFNHFRVQIMNQCVYNSPAYYLLKHWHHLFLSSDIDMNNPPKYNGYFKRKMNYYDLYCMLINVNTELNAAYNLMDDYRIFNSTATADNCAEKLDQIIADFIEKKLPCYENFTQLLINWHDEIINSFITPDGKYKLSNALAENINQRIRKLISVSNGYSNFERFRARVLFCMNNKVYYSLTSSIMSNKRTGKKRGPYKHKDTTLFTENTDDEE